MLFRSMAQVYANLKNSVAGNTVADVLARIQAEIDRLAKEPGRFAARRGESDKGLEETKTVSPAELISNLRHQYRIIQNQPKTADPWTSSFNALIQETNAKALLASQELDFATKLLASEERLLAQEQANIDAVKKEPYSGTTGVRMSNAEYKYDQQLERVQDANVEYGNKQAAYQIARLEQLNLLKAYGGDLQANINAEVEKIQTLTPQLEQQAKENAENKAQLQKANQALAKVRVEERKKAAETVPSQTAGLSYSAQEREALKRIREGLGLPGTRYETDTTSTLVVKTKAAIRQTLTLEQSKLDKAREADDVAKVQEQTLRVQELQQAFESVQDLGERVVTPVGEGAAERTVEREESGVLPGTRLPRRRVGPVARVGTQPPGQMLSGTAESREAISKGNRPMQVGTQRLTSADMDPQSASSVSLAVLKQQLDAATGNRKTMLQAAYKDATSGMTDAQIKGKIKEGEDLIAVPGAAAVVAAREKVRAADAVLLGQPHLVDPAAGFELAREDALTQAFSDLFIQRAGDQRKRTHGLNCKPKENFVSIIMNDMMRQPHKNWENPPNKVTP